EAPGVVLPGVVAELARLRDGVEGPDQRAGARAEGAHVAGRIVAIGQAIADAGAEDDEVLVDERGRRVRVGLAIDRPDRPPAQSDEAVLAERVDRRAGRGIEADETIAAVDEYAQRVVAAGIAPRGDAAMHEAGAVRRLAVLVGFRIVRPLLG